MFELALILRTQRQFYRRHPLISALFLLGLSLGTALISAITHLNTEAGQRYQIASDQTASPIHYLIKPVAGQRYFPASIWFALRRHGIAQSQPVLTGQVRLEDGRSLLIRGVNALALLEATAPDNKLGSQASALQFAQPAVNTPFFIATELAERLNISHLQFKTDPQHYGFITQPGIGPWLITDIGLAHQLLQQQGWIEPDSQPITLIELGALTELEQQKIEQIIGDQAVLSNVAQQSFDALSESFFFNLTALALLGYAVGLFLSLNALRLMLSARNRMQEQMATLGCLPKRLQQALGIEMILVCALCAALGNSLGFWIAQGLMFDVTTTLISLYQLDRALDVHWQWQGFVIGFAMNLLALAAMLFSLKQQANASALSAIAATKKHNLTQALKQLTIAVLLVAGGGIYRSASNKYEALLLCGWIIVLFAVFTLPILRQCSQFANRFSLNKTTPPHPLAQWLKANIHKHLQDVSLAMLAFLIALGAAIGTQVMVRSFALTLDTYLQQRLQADLYLRANDPQQQFSPARSAALQQLPEVAFVSNMETAEANVLSANSDTADSTQLISYGDQVHHYQHLSRTDGQMMTLEHVSNGNCLANEPSALRYGWKLGDNLPITQGNQSLTCTVSGFFFDYGTQRINLVVSQNTLQQSQFSRQFIGYALTLNESAEADALTKKLINQLGYSEDNIVQNATFKRIAKRLFSNTFAITDVLNTLIVSIALIAIWVSFLSMNQQQQNQFGLVQALGVTPGELFIGQLLVTASLLLLTLLLAIPLGISLGHVLLKFVMPISFGWSMPMVVDWANLATLSAVILVIAFGVTSLSIWRLQKQPIANLIREKP